MYTTSAFYANNATARIFLPLKSIKNIGLGVALITHPIYGRS
jgi:hypothetical protein